jgi:hypothetical protein
MLSKNDLRHLLNAIEAAEAEFEELMLEREWYVTEVTDQLASAKQIVQEELESYDNKQKDRTSTTRQEGSPITGSVPA